MKERSEPASTAPNFTSMVEVFKTNVEDTGNAHLLIGHIHQAFIDYKANFDLKDCDNILRIKSVTGLVEPKAIINLLRELGFHAEVLPDDCPPARHISTGKELL